MTVILGNKGQIVIPKDIRERHGLHPGDELVIAENQGALIVRKKTRNPGLLKHLLACPSKSLRTPSMMGDLRSPQF